MAVKKKAPMDHELADIAREKAVNHDGMTLYYFARFDKKLHLTRVESIKVGGKREEKILKEFEE